MYIETFELDAVKGASDAKDFVERWKAEEREISFLAVHHQAGILTESLKDILETKSNALHGASSCQGIMLNNGTAKLGVFAISDPDGDYGTAAVSIAEGNALSAARDAVLIALRNAGREGEAPDMIWISITPGSEELALKGIEQVVGSEIPIIGGSAADDTISGQWRVTDGGESYQSGLVVSVLFCSTPIHFAYQNGYEPTDKFGVVTKATGRKLFEIEGRPAADVYCEWNENQVPNATKSKSKNILSEATLFPLGRNIGSLGLIPQYLLAHPCTSNPDGSIELFAEIEVGETLTQMKGDRKALAQRAERVAEFTLKAGGISNQEIAGALMVYCGGCMLAVQDKLDVVYSGVNSALNDRPFLGVFTFGEQGSVHNSGNKHGNLMVSCIAFQKS